MELYNQIDNYLINSEYLICEDFYMEKYSYTVKSNNIEYKIVIWFNLDNSLDVKLYIDDSNIDEKDIISFDEFKDFINSTDNFKFYL